MTDVGQTESPDTRGASVTLCYSDTKDSGGEAPSTRVETLLAYADDELILGWRDSEWTGIAPTLEEDVAFSSIAQNEIGHARALYELAAAELTAAGVATDADALAFDRPLDEYRCAPLVELRLVDDWAHTIARRWLYEEADRIRLAALVAGADAELAGLAAKIEREEVYHRMHAELWHERLRTEPRFVAAADELWPYALGLLSAEQRPLLADRLDRPCVTPTQGALRGGHTDELAGLWAEMTEVRRSVPGATW